MSTQSDRSWLQMAATHDIETAKALGYFSIGLGLTELFAGGYLSRLTGLGQPSLVRAFGARELAAGVMVLTSPDAPSGLWTRVAGDMLDLAVLGTALGRRNPQRGGAVIASLLVAGVTALDILCATSLQARGARAQRTAERTRVARKVPARAARKPRARARAVLAS